MQWLVALLALLAGCAGMNESPRGEPIPADFPVGDAPFAEPPSAIVVDVGTEAAPVVASPLAQAELPTASGPPPPVLAPAKAAPAAVLVPVPVPVPVPVAKVPPRKKDDPVAAIAPVAPALDVAALKARLRDTAAIGVLGKISLSKQMDALLESFRAHYGGAPKTSLAALRKPYDELVMRVLDMLDERDPSLARSISSSREAIWEILADRERFGLMR
jgi:hypothetical protein